MTRLHWIPHETKPKPIDMTHQERIDDIACRTHQYDTLIGYLSSSRVKDATDLGRIQEANRHLKEIHRHMRAIQKRCSAIFDILLAQTDMKDKVGRWTMEIEPDIGRFLAEARERGERNSIRYAIGYARNARWEGNLKDSLLYRVTDPPLTIPVEWLDLPAQEIKKRITR